jgi:hypothetical protein
MSAPSVQSSSRVGALHNVASESTTPTRSAVFRSLNVEPELQTLLECRPHRELSGFPLHDKIWAAIPKFFRCDLDTIGLTRSNLRPIFFQSRPQAL